MIVFANCGLRSKYVAVVDDRARITSYMSYALAV